MPSLHDEFERAERMLARATAAEAKLAKIEALLERPHVKWGSSSIRRFAAELRMVLDD